MTPQGGRRYRGQSPDERRAERRRRLLDAALELFGTIGYGASSIEMVCATAGVTARHFYEHFEGREALMIALFDEENAQVIEAVISSAVAADPDLDSRIDAGVAAFMHGMLDDPRRARVLCLECVGVSPEVEQRRRAGLHTYANFVSAQAGRLTGDGSAPPSSFDLLSLALVGGTNELIVEWLSGDLHPSISVLIGEVSAFFRAAGQVASDRWGDEPAPSLEALELGIDLGSPDGAEPDGDGKA